MPYYESVFIARQDISAPQVDSLAEGFTKAIEEQGGQVTKKEYWGLRTLAYRIRKNRKGHYVLFNIDGPAAAVQEMERQMRISEDVLRCLTVRVDELEEGPSVQMQRGVGRDERPRRSFHGDRRPDQRGAPESGSDNGKPATPPEDKNEGSESAASPEAPPEGGDQ